MTDAATADLPDSADRLAYSLDDFCKAVPCSRPTAYAAIRAGRLQAKKLGVRTLIPAPAARAFIANLPDMKSAA
ncbi:helix-turn-helix domain-containing protein [Reyranella soli]|uniref:Helix-turn-helix domain-containing protein n=1 Tax=Reyranella soli TaxID=1230389 RepID=A0A512NEE5_9HYPH|nr:helix-turn-helix domain-containing protein [Reyranella soli]GEP57327.1 hypothetical protein RSO01_44930 [Reyranella soli]